MRGIGVGYAALSCRLDRRILPRPRGMAAWCVSSFSKLLLRFSESGRCMCVACVRRLLWTYPSVLALWQRGVLWGGDFGLLLWLYLAGGLV